MIRPPPTVSLLFVWGLSVLLGGSILYSPGDRVGLGGGLRWLTVVVVLLVGVGLVLSGLFMWRDGWEYAREMRIPALILVGVGASALGGGPLLFRPWAYEGLAGGINAIGLAAFLVGGGLFIATGVYCYQTQNQTVPLTIFAGLTGAGAFYPLDASGVTGGFHPILWVAVVVLFVGGPALAVYYRWPHLRDTGSSPA